MAKRLYRRTGKGTAVWQRQDPSVPLEFRRILGIVEGDMHPDSMRGRLPFTEIGLHQLLEELVEEGFLISRERRGYFVNEDILRGQVQLGGSPRPAVAPAASPGPDWARRFRVHPTAQRNIVKPRNWQQFAYPFIYGQYDPELFPIAAWRECTRQAQSLDSIRDWAIDRFTDDDPLLIEQIRTRLLPRRGCSPPPTRSW